MGYFLFAIVILILVFISLGLLMAFKIAVKKKKPDVDILELKFPCHEPKYAKEIKDWIQTIPLKYIKIKSPFFYNLNSLEINNGDSEKWVILLHGVTLNHKSMLDLAYLYSRMGYNIILWDSRYHGKSEGRNVSYGYYEKHDLKAVVDYLRTKYGKGIKIGIHGVSMGAGILLSYACSVRDDCDFYIADCPYSNFKQQAFDVAKRDLKLPGFIVSIILFFGQFFIRMIFGYDIGKIDIKGRIHRLENPVLFISCKDDGYIDPNMTKELFEGCKANIKDIIWFENGGHGGAFPYNKDEFIAGVKGFLKKIKF